MKRLTKAQALREEVCFTGNFKTDLPKLRRIQIPLCNGKFAWLLFPHDFVEVDKISRMMKFYSYLWQENWANGLTEALIET